MAKQACVYQTLQRSHRFYKECVNSSIFPFFWVLFFLLRQIGIMRSIDLHAFTECLILPNHAFMSTYNDYTLVWTPPVSTKFCWMMQEMNDELKSTMISLYTIWLRVLSQVRLLLNHKLWRTTSFTKWICSSICRSNSCTSIFPRNHDPSVWKENNKDSKHKNKRKHIMRTPKRGMARNKL